ncbi:18099_t:CDS:2 [Funneliformis geosporum]|uniref:6786_t:CDS:1 n=1 Tax=Funneliformis geosporum TaxID=1117311 RepID=A0A9W4SBV0_9GLOM|nr:18099_t:CDS:2 [Funneliformis geosporum]CAI2163331.1 6786_t:CDS:2 [Funneliformis geosporum]
MVYLVHEYKRIEKEYSIILREQIIDEIDFNITICTGISNIKFGIQGFANKPFLKYKNIKIPPCQHFLFKHIKSREVIWWNASVPLKVNDTFNNVGEYLKHYYSRNHTDSLSLIIGFTKIEYLKKSFDLIHLLKGNIKNYDDNKLSFDTKKTILINPGQALLISLKDYIANSDGKLSFNPQLEKIPIKLEPNEFQFGIHPMAKLIKFENKKKYTYVSLVSNLGGFYSAIGGIFILFFGMPKLSPWGLAQKYILSCVPCRKSFTKSLARKYVSSAGIPLAEKVNKRPEASSLEQRIQILETLLHDYYLDDSYLKLIKRFKIQHKRRLEKFNIEGENNPLFSSENDNEIGEKQT